MCHWSWILATWWVVCHGTSVMVFPCVFLMQPSVLPRSWNAFLNWVVCPPVLICTGF
jgi:hypothetical protein